MHLPLKNLVLSSATLLLLLVASGCAKVSATRTADYASRGDHCALSWQMGDYPRLAADYEWVGEVTLHSERGVVLSDADRTLVEGQACQLGGDTVLRNVGRATGTGLASFADQKFGVLRRRSHEDTSGSDSGKGMDLPAHGGSEQVAAGGHRGASSLR
jgi:hypothetical protein